MNKRESELIKDSGNIKTEDPYAKFIYLLMRDYVSAGQIESLLQDVISGPTEVEFLNGWLGQYAVNISETLKNSDKYGELGNILEQSLKDIESSKRKDPIDSAKVHISNLRDQGAISEDDAKRMYDELKEVEEENGRNETEE